MKFNSRVIFALIILIIVAAFFGITYNSLVKKNEQVNNDWSNLQSMYQRRTDLIPSLVSVVRGSAEYEKKVLEDITALRSKAGAITVSANANAADYQNLEVQQAQTVASMNRIIAAIEDYPDIKTSKSFRALQTQLEGTERRIKVARDDFNKSVADYNIKTRSFPSNIAASLFGFKTKEGFKANAGADQSPEVKFK